MKAFLGRWRSGRGPVLAVFLPILALNLWCGIELRSQARQRERIKDDYAHIHSIGNGLLSVEAWKSHLRNIISERILKLAFTPEEESMLLFEMERVLKRLLQESDAVLRRPQKTFKGKVRKLVYKAAVDVDDLEEETPRFARAILDEIRKPENLEKLKALALSQLDRAASEGRDEGTGPASVAGILERYRMRSVEEFTTHADTRLASIERRVRLCMAAMVGSLAFTGAVWWWARRKPQIHRALFSMSVALGIIVLLSSLAVPMIDIDARIANVDLVLLGERVAFTNQLVFYRSKSILQMVEILLSSRKADSFIVGVLVFLFSVAFPIAKLGASLAVLFARNRERLNWAVRFFAFHSGKWSMADVMVVAIFMAYIGFNGVLNSQLKNLNITTESWQIITTNETALQPGFVLFLAYVLFSLTLSEILTRLVASTNAQPRG